MSKIVILLEKYNAYCGYFIYQRKLLQSTINIISNYLLPYMKQTIISLFWNMLVVFYRTKL